MVDTKGFEISYSQATQASQTWDKDDKYWACDGDGNLESTKAGGDNDDNGHPTKWVWQAGTQNSDLVQVVSDGYS